MFTTFLVIAGTLGIITLGAVLLYFGYICYWMASHLTTVYALGRERAESLMEQERGFHITFHLLECVIWCYFWPVALGRWFYDRVYRRYRIIHDLKRAYPNATITWERHGNHVTCTITEERSIADDYTPKSSAMPDA